jgi:hypothetical protein
MQRAQKGKGKLRIVHRAYPIELSFTTDTHELINQLGTIYNELAQVSAMLEKQLSPENTLSPVAHPDHLRDRDLLT